MIGVRLKRDSPDGRYTMSREIHSEQYAGALSAWNSSLGTHGKYGVAVCTLWADNKKEAYRFAIDATLETFPISDGWVQHDASVMLIPPWVES